jgi:hypothetical protein
MYKVMHKPIFVKHSDSLCIAKWYINGKLYMEAHDPLVPVTGGWMYEAS